MPNNNDNNLSFENPRPVTVDELIQTEARSLAKEAIQTALDRQGLPLPKDSVLDTHINELLHARPDFLTSAAERVEAKKDAYSQALRAIGIEPIIVEPLDL